MKLHTIVLFLVVCLASTVFSQCDWNALNKAVKKVAKYINKDAVNKQLLKRKGGLSTLAKNGDIEGMQKALGTRYIQLLQKFRSVVNNNALRGAYHKMIVRQKAVQKQLGELKPGNKSDEKKASGLACELVTYKAGLLNEFTAKKEKKE